MSRSQDSVKYGKYGRNNLGECFGDLRGSFGCGKQGHRLRDCPHVRQGSKDIRPQSQAASALAPTPYPTPAQAASFSTTGSQCQNRFYALPSHQEQEDSPDVVSGMLCVFCLDVYVLFDPK